MVTEDYKGLACREGLECLVDGEDAERTNFSGNVKSGFFVIGMLIGALVFSAFILGWVVQFFALIGI